MYLAYYQKKKYHPKNLIPYARNITLPLFELKDRVVDIDLPRSMGEIRTNVTPCDELRERAQYFCAILQWRQSPQYDMDRYLLDYSRLCTPSRSYFL